MRFVVLLAVALSLVGCSGDLASLDEGFENAEIAGAVRIPLLAQGSDGTTYQLRGATFEISGAAMMTLRDRDRRHDDELVTQLPPGEYNLFLRPGWEIVAVAADGTTSTPVASLTSRNPAHFSVGQMSDTSLELEFASNDLQLTFGTGTPVRVSTADNQL